MPNTIDRRLAVRYAEELIRRHFPQHTTIRQAIERIEREKENNPFHNNIYWTLKPKLNDPDINPDLPLT